MKRMQYFNHIEDKLSCLSTRIRVRGKRNLLELHNHSENFYKDFFNILFKYELRNLNVLKANYEGVDLVDDTNKVFVQVSSLKTKEKIQSTLDKDLGKYSDYRFIYLCLLEGAYSLRGKVYDVPPNIKFNPEHDIYDLQLILSKVQDSGIDELKGMYELVVKDLASLDDLNKVESNLASIINILSASDLNDVQVEYNIDPYEVGRKVVHNNLSAQLIDDYKVYYSRLDKIYGEFDGQGLNKSLSVLNSIRRFYLNNMNNLSGDELFQKIISCVLVAVKESGNYKEMPFEELMMAVEIVVVDAFIRCKIFENPESYNHVNAR